MPLNNRYLPWRLPFLPLINVNKVLVDTCIFLYWGYWAGILGWNFLCATLPKKWRILLINIYILCNPYVPCNENIYMFVYALILVLVGDKVFSKFKIFLNFVAMPADIELQTLSNTSASKEAEVCGFCGSTKTIYVIILLNRYYIGCKCNKWLYVSGGVWLWRHGTSCLYCTSAAVEQALPEIQSILSRFEPKWCSSESYAPCNKPRHN